MFACTFGIGFVFCATMVTRRLHSSRSPQSVDLAHKLVDEVPTGEP